jgi:glc operon protein GlcG
MLTRNNIRLTLEGARAILAAAESKAREINVAQNIALVDEGGHLLIFARMDGAKLSSVEVALTKARAAALRRSPTGPAPAESSLAFEAACR